MKLECEVPARDEELPCIRLIDCEGRFSLGFELSKAQLFFALVDGVRLGYKPQEIDFGGVRVEMDPKATSFLAKTMRVDDWNGRRDRQVVAIAQYCVDEAWSRLEALAQARELDRATASVQAKSKRVSRM